MLTPNQLNEKSLMIRRQLLELIVGGRSGHTGGSLSETDILTVLFYNIMKYDVKSPYWEDRDRFILSKGHSVEAYYVILSDLGFFDETQLNTFMQFNTKLIGHPSKKVPGVEVNSGALGHGLSVGVGMALAMRMNKKDSRVFVLMGDGELAEGSVWEAAMAASHYKLDNLHAIVDRNRLQISGETKHVMNTEPLEQKWESFGFRVLQVDGHNYEQLQSALTDTVPDKPTVVIADTIKGKGVSFMENVAKWHHGVPSSEQLKQALCEMEGTL